MTEGAAAVQRCSALWSARSRGAAGCPQRCTNWEATLGSAAFAPRQPVGSLDLAALGPGGGVCEAVVYQPVPGFLPRVGVRQFSGLYRLAALILAEH
jgi:hypothetical protein